MPFTFVEIEEHRTRKLAWLFTCLVLLYVVSFLALWYGGGALLFRGSRILPTRLIIDTTSPDAPDITLRPAELPSLPVHFVVNAFALAIVAAAIHWYCSIYNLVDRVMATLQARPLDPGDTYHQRLRNVVEEAGVATGGRYRITPYVISTSALNACAVADFDRRAAIAVTEGLLSKLTREQLEGVVGHEAAHIARGDSLAKSVFTGLFGLHEEVLKHLTGAFEQGGVRGRGGAFVLFVMLVLWVTKTAKRLCELGISRQMEYRADAVAVRLTRNPIGLAEALQLMEPRWRGVGAYGESLSTIFILDPGADRLSERQDPVSAMFSTHPPTARRLNALLGMVRVEPVQFREELERRPAKPQIMAPSGAQPAAGAAPMWLAYVNGAWTAPMALAELAARPDLLPETWVKPADGGQVIPAYRQAELFSSIQHRYNPEGVNVSSGANCPKCRVGLMNEVYEGVPLGTCPACRGRYVTTDQLTRILLRRDYAFPEAISRLAKAIPPAPQRRVIERAFRQDRRVHWRCPKCQATIHRKFYSVAYFVDVEQCVFCGMTWLDRDELELIQYLYEHRSQHE